MDLDQAMHLERLGNGYRVRYAIADVGAVVPAGGGSRPRRGSAARPCTARTPGRCSTPRRSREGAASLLPDVDRPAFVFQVDLDADGRQIAAQVEPRIVRSRHKLDLPVRPRAAAGGDRKLRAAPGRRARRPCCWTRPPGGGARRPAAGRLPAGAGGSVTRSRTGTPRSRCWPGWRRRTMMIAGGLGLLRTMTGIDDYRLARLRRTAPRCTCRGRTA